MTHNCFSYTFENLVNKFGNKIPTTWREYSSKDFEYFSLNAKKLLVRKIHIQYFDSFCTRVKRAKKYDVILNDECMGIAINRFKFMTLKAKNNMPTIEDIKKSDIKMRVL